MKMMKSVLGFLFMVFMAIVATPAFAGDVTHSTPGLSGYDPVAYFTEGKPMKGSGYHVAEHLGVTYAFATKEHKRLFEENPEKYVPAYGGYCAYGVAVGKKFVSDPEAWKIVEGRLYLNLDRDIQSKWAKDIPGYLKKSEVKWQDIKDKAASAL
ncbi:MAG: YHS domain protein [Nitrospira sp.]|nr:YHS domain protein [Nitrospira sp.]